MSARVNNRRENTKELLKNIKDLVTINGKKGLIHINKATLLELEEANFISEITELKNNVWYKIPDLDMSFLEVIPDYCILVMTDDVGELDRYNWKYDYKEHDVVGEIINSESLNNSEDGLEGEIAGFGIDYSVLCINKNGKVCTDYELLRNDVHCAWLRLCMIPDTLLSIQPSKHKRMHELIGDYNTDACLEIGCIDDLCTFTQEVIRIRNVLSDKEFNLLY